MKLNEKGKTLLEIGDAIWDKGIEMSKAENGEDNYEGGWSVAEDYDLVTSAEAFIGLMFAANGDSTIAYMCEMFSGNADDWFGWDKTYRQMIEILLSCVESITEKEQKAISKILS